MTITLPLQPREEAKLIAIAQAKGLSADALVREAIDNILAAESVPSSGATGVFQKEEDVWVLRTGQPISATAVEDILNGIRQERDLASLGPLR
jgi:hypothetical protein